MGSHNDLSLKIVAAESSFSSFSSLVTQNHHPALKTEGLVKESDLLVWMFFLSISHSNLVRDDLALVDRVALLQQWSMGEDMCVDERKDPEKHKGLILRKDFVVRRGHVVHMNTEGHANLAAYENTATSLHPLKRMVQMVHSSGL